MKQAVSVLFAVIMLIGVIAGCNSGNSSDSSNSSNSSGSSGSSNSSNSSNSSTTEQTATAPADETKNFNETGFPITKDKITLKAVIRKTANDGPMQDMWFFKEYEKMTNIHLDIQEIDEKVYLERIALMFASGDIPDVFLGYSLTPNDEIKYGVSGQLLALNDLIDKYAPNLKKIDEDKVPGVLKTISAPDGNIYSLPVFTRKSDYLYGGQRPYINVNWLNEAGLTMPQTLDEFYTALQAFKTKHPDAIPLSGVYNTQSVGHMIMGALGLPYNPNPSNGDILKYLDAVDGKVYFSPAHQNYRKYLEFMKKIYDEGLLDQEYFTQTVAQLKAKGADFKLGAFIFSANFTMVGTKEEDYKQYEFMDVLTSDVNTNKVVFSQTGVSTGGAILTKNNKYPEATVRYLDYLYSSEGTNLVRTGYGITDPAFMPLVAWQDEQQTKWKPAWPEKYNGEAAYMNAEIAPSTLLPQYFPEDILQPKKIISPEAVILNSETDEKMQYFKPFFSAVYLTKEEQDSINLIQKDIMTYVQQMEAKFILSSEPMDNFDKYLAELNKLGLDQMLAAYQNAYDRTK